MFHIVTTTYVLVHATSTGLQLLIPCGPQEKVLSGQYKVLKGPQLVRGPQIADYYLLESQTKMPYFTHVIVAFSAIPNCGTGNYSHSVSLAVPENLKRLKCCHKLFSCRPRFPFFNSCMKPAKNPQFRYPPLRFTALHVLKKLPDIRSISEKWRVCRSTRKICV